MQGAVAVVTGGGRGIGAAVALALARAGASVIVAARTAPEIEGVTAQARAAGGSAIAVPADVTAASDVVRVVERALAVNGAIDVLVNAAGIVGPVGPVWDADPDGWRRAFDVNVHGTFLCCRAVLPHMIRRRRGKIINFSGGGAASPVPRLAAYGASKAAVVRLTETMAQEVAPYNIQVNAIAPGLVDTRLLDDVLAARERGGEQSERVRRLRETGYGGVPAELPASLALWLASDKSRGLTGKLVAAPYDRWERWDAHRIDALAAAPWFTLRRLDRVTIAPLVGDLDDAW
jgi:NAD(P)-dependent dehydrogenase (short-subunit alcohol dehydrogenase family)